MSVLSICTKNPPALYSCLNCSCPLLFELEMYITENQKCHNQSQSSAWKCFNVLFIVHISLFILTYITWACLEEIVLF